MHQIETLVCSFFVFIVYLFLTVEIVPDAHSCRHVTFASLELTRFFTDHTFTAFIRNDQKLYLRICQL